MVAFMKKLTPVTGTEVAILSRIMLGDYSINVEYSKEFWADLEGRGLIATRYSIFSANHPRGIVLTGKGYRQFVTSTIP